MVKGAEGKCMFVWECINSGGSHIGMCVDTFMFGTCCTHNGGEAGRDPGEPSVLYSPPRRPKPPSQSRPNDQPTTRPTFITRPHRPASSQHYDKWTKPLTTTDSHLDSNQLDVTWAPQRPGFVTRPGRPTKLRPAPPPTTTQPPPAPSSTTATTTTTASSTTQQTMPSTTFSTSQSSAANGT
ncbi:serine proteinase stubble [Halyomorpha halys]|uniref:serine proteinase stubble n=1 Tax=Halyomorpha halys TaxID=286706 RepID=UPI0006D52886